MNKVILMGRLTRDPEVRYGGTDNSVAIARFSLAVDRRGRRQNDGAEADFFNCTALGKLGEFAERYLKQGTKVLLTGRIENNNYTNKDGQKVYSVQVIAEELEFAESKNAGGSREAQTQAAPAPAPAPMPAPAEAVEGFMNVPDNVSEADLPFN